MVLALADTVLERFGAKVSFADACRSSVEVRPLDWPELDTLLPDHGFPRGVVELRPPRALGGATCIALAAIRAAHAKDERAWCAWIDPDETLYAPGVATAGVDLNRLAIVRPSRAAMLRVAAKVVRSQAFDVIVVDLDPAPCAGDTSSPMPSRTSKRGASLDVSVRKLALLAAESGSTVILITDATVARPAPLPVALRLDLVHGGDTLGVRVTKDRYGRIGLAKTVSLDSKPGIELAG
jgi:recombination protein RecA